MLTLRNTLKYKTHSMFALATAALVFAMPRDAHGGAVILQGNVTVDASTAISGNFNTVVPGPILEESVIGEWTAGSTITISAPLNFAFDTSQSVTAGIVSPADATFALTSATATPTASAITFTVAAASTTVKTQLQFNNIRLRATSCAPAVNPGDTAGVTVTSSAAAVMGNPLVNITVSSANGPLHHFRLTANPPVAQVGTPITITVRAEDACNNPTLQGAAPPANIHITAGGAPKAFASGDVPGNFTLSNVTPNSADILAAGNIFDANGLGTFKITSPVPEGPIAVTLTAGTITGAANVTVINATIALTPATATNLAGTPHTVTATVLRNGAPVANIFVNFQVTGVNNLVGVGITSASGQAAFTYAGIAGTPGVGTDTINASTAVEGVPAMATPVTKTWINPTCSLELIPPTNPKLVGQTSTVRVSLVDGNPLAPVVGQTVTFLVTSGPNAGLTFTGATNGAGQLDFSGYTTATAGGTDVIAVSGTHLGIAFACTISQEWILTGATLTPVTATNRVGTSHALIATVAKNGILQSGLSVTFTIVGPNAGASGTATTNALGQATFIYTGANPGDDTVTASGTVGGQPFTSNSATKHWVDPVCTLTPATSTNLAGTSHTVTANVLRFAGGPAAVGATVNFSVTAGPNAGLFGTSATNVSGNASFTYSSNGLPGTDTISATAVLEGVNSITPCTATKDWVLTGCSLDPPTDTNPIGTPHTVTATVLLNNAPAPGVTVNFATTGANVGAGTDITDANGHAEFTYTGAAPGIDTITASGTVSVGGASIPFSCTATKKWVSFNCNLTVDAPVGRVGTTTAATAHVLVDGAVPLFPSGVPVHFQVSTGPNVGNAGIVNTNGAGEAVFTYASNGLPGTDTISATVTLNNSIFDCSTVTRTWINPSCSFDPTTPALAGTPRTFTITVLRSPGVPAAGVAVNFVATGANAASGPGDPPFLTDANGRLGFTYTGLNTGTDSITATTTVDTVGPTTCSVTQEWSNTGCSLTPATSTNQVGTSHTVTVEVLKNGIAQAGIIIGFEVVSGPNLGKTDAGFTNAAGQASITYTGDGGTGTDTIHASGTVNGTPFTCAATKEWIDVGCTLVPASAANQIGTSHSVTITLTKNGVAQGGVTVNFNVTAGPNAGQTNLRLTNASGQATFVYTGGATPGVDTIEATGIVSGVAFTCTATKEWVNVTCNISPASDTNVVNTVHLVDARILKNGSPAAGVTVHFTVSGGPNAGLVGSGVTDADGNAVFTYTGSAVAGTDTITASGDVGGVPFSCNATKTWIANDLDTVPPGEEDQCVPGGDGNGDGVADSLQSNVASLLDIFGQCVTIESPVGTTLVNVQALSPPSPELAPPGVIFPYGFFSYEIHNIQAGASLDVRVFLHGGPTVNTYYKFGATPIIAVDHYYRFLDDGTTGVEVAANVLTLHLIDGRRGDDDITANGIIVEPGGPALEADNPAPLTAPSASCGACGAGAVSYMPVMIAGLGLMRWKRIRRSV